MLPTWAARDSYEIAFIVLIFFGVFVPPALGAVCGRIWDAFSASGSRR